MRLSAYKRSIDGAMKLPTTVEGIGYFESLQHNPREIAIGCIENAARLDVDGLFSGEYIELVKYIDTAKLEARE